MSSLRTYAAAAVRTLTRAVDAVADSRLGGPTHPELLSVWGELETIARRLPAAQHVILARLQREASPAFFHYPQRLLADPEEPEDDP